MRAITKLKGHNSVRVVVILHSIANLFSCFVHSGCKHCKYMANTICLPAAVAHWDALSDWRPGGRRSNPRRCRQSSFVEIDHEIFSTLILSLPLIQEGQLSVSGKKIRTLLVNHLED